MATMRCRITMQVIMPGRKRSYGDAFMLLIRVYGHKNTFVLKIDRDGVIASLQCADIIMVNKPKKVGNH